MLTPLFIILFMYFKYKSVINKYISYEIKKYFKMMELKYYILSQAQITQVSQTCLDFRLEFH